MQLKGFAVHSIRHGSATHMLETGVDVYHLQKNEVVEIKEEEHNGRIIAEKKQECSFCHGILLLYRKGWVVNVRPLFSKANTVIEYLSRYLNRVAISNSRILKVDNGEVTFRWKDNRDGKEKLMTLDAIEFIRRFLLHILPERFVKIRYFGFMSISQGKSKLDKIKSKLEPKDYLFHRAGFVQLNRI